MDKKQLPAPLKFLREALIVIVSALFGSSVQIFVMIPNGMTSGGVPGIARLITHFFPVSYALVYYTISMVIIIIAFLTMGMKELRRILALCLTYPVLLYIFEHFDYAFLQEQDRFLAALLIGVFYGLGTGIGYIGGYSSGGTDTMARVLKFKLFNHLHTGDIQMAIDMTIVVISAFVFNTNIAIYAVVTTYVAAKVISAVMVGYNGKFVQFDIISTEADRISEFIMNEVHRAVTSHVSTGEYSHSERRTLTVICTPAEVVRIKKYVAEVDPKAFATVQQITSVWGMDKSFAKITEVENT